MVGAAVEVQAVAAAGKQHHRVFFGVGFFRALFRQGGGFAAAVGVAVGGDRAFAAARPAASTDAVAKIHQALGVAAQGGGVVRQARFGLTPEGGEGCRLVSRAVDARVAGEQAFDVAVEDGFFLSVGEDGDGGGGAAADAFQRFQPGAVARELPAVFAHDLPGCVVQVARAAVVAKA